LSNEYSTKEPEGNFVLINSFNSNISV
jgi:hypothetical protein